MGRVLNALGMPIDGGRPLAVSTALPLEGVVRSPLDRVPIREPSVPASAPLTRC